MREPEPTTICEHCIHPRRSDLRSCIRELGVEADDECEWCGHHSAKRIALWDLKPVFERLVWEAYKNVADLEWPFMKEMEAFVPEGESIAFLLEEDWGPIWHDECADKDRILEIMNGRPLTPEEVHYRQADGGYYEHAYEHGWIRKTDDYLESEDDEWIIEQAMDDDVSAACKYPRVLGYRAILSVVLEALEAQGLALRFGRDAARWIRDRRLKEAHSRFWGDIDTLTRTYHVGKKLWRARELPIRDVISPNDLTPCDLGAPPPALVRDAGRANLAGQPFLYLANTLKCALSEVRNSGSDKVAHATFQLTQTVELLDLRGSREPQMPFQLLEKDFDRYHRAVPLANILRKHLAPAFARTEETKPDARGNLFSRFLTQLLFHDGRVHGLCYDSTREAGAYCIALFSPGDAEYVGNTLEISKM